MSRWSILFLWWCRSSRLVYVWLCGFYQLWGCTVASTRLLFILLHERERGKKKEKKRKKERKKKNRLKFWVLSHCKKTPCCPIVGFWSDDTPAIWILSTTYLQSWIPTLCAACRGNCALCFWQNIDLFHDNQVQTLESLETKEKPLCWRNRKGNICACDHNSLFLENSGFKMPQLGTVLKEFNVLFRSKWQSAVICGVKPTAVITWH